jgi:NADH:ubiquinone oxidoreductase subunit 4 (subunit M)
VQTVAPRGAFVVVVLAVLLIYFGVYPSPLLDLIRTTMAGISFAIQMGPH